MLRTGTWLARAAGLTVVGLITFLNPPPVHDRLVTQIVAYAVVCVAVAAWGVFVLDSRLPERLTRVGLPIALGVVTIAGAVGGAAGAAGYVLIAFAMVATMAAGEGTPTTAALAVVGVGMLAVEISGLVFSQSIAALLGYPLLLVVGLLTGRNRAAYRIQAEQSALLLAQYEQLRVEQRRADVLDERTRIAREIHDVLAHSLGALGIQIQVGARRADRPAATSTARLRRCRPPSGWPPTAWPRPAAPCTRCAPTPSRWTRSWPTGRRHAPEAARVRVACDISGAAAPLPPDATVALLRTVQEALVNAAKHAPGQPVEVDLDYADTDVRLTVSTALARLEQAPRQRRPCTPSTADTG